jgi:hypothetical protein
MGSPQIFLKSAIASTSYFSHQELSQVSHLADNKSQLFLPRIKKIEALAACPTSKFLQ